MTQHNKNWIQKITLNSIKQTLSSSFHKFTHFLAFPKRFYEQKPRLAITLAISTFLVTGGLSYLVANQQKALYFPAMGFGRSNLYNPRRMRHPAARELQSDDLELRTEDGVVLRGWHIKRENSERIIVYFHGNAGNIGTRLPFAQSLMQQTNSDVIMVAYRGYSDSDGQPTQKGLEKDAQTILNKALEIAKREKKRLYVFGTSLGGAVTIYVSGLPIIREEISGVIVQNTFTSTTDVITAISPVLKVLAPFLRMINRNSWNSFRKINQLRRPILFIKCGMDEIVPPNMSDRLRDECNKHHIANYLYELPNGRHNEVHIADPVRYFSQLNEFFRATL